MKASSERRCLTDTMGVAHQTSNRCWEPLRNEYLLLRPCGNASLRSIVFVARPPESIALLAPLPLFFTLEKDVVEVYDREDDDDR